MFDIGAAEILLIVIVAIIVIGPSEMPRALRTAGQWIGKVRRVSSHFRAGIDAMVREAEIEEMEKEWKDRNAQIMAEHPDEMLPAEPDAADTVSAEAKAEPTDLTQQVSADDPYPPKRPSEKPPEVVKGDPDELADAARERARPDTARPAPEQPDDEPSLPFGTRRGG